MIHVCVPVLRRYDLLREMLLSLHRSMVKPETVFIINNGRDDEKLEGALDASPVKTFVHTPLLQMGVAESWNWFMQHVPEERLISNDDVTFAPESLSRFLASSADLVWAKGVGFSCFLIRDACIEKIGYFDETISPGYGYYEDEDYLQRLDGRGTRVPSAVAENIESGVRHVHSATLKSASHKQLIEHHRLFKIAQGNYIKKWHLEETFQ